MKKLRFFTLMLVLALVLTGCGAGEVPGGTVETLPPQTQPAETQPTVPQENLSIGRMEGGRYVNSYAGFGCDLDESWIFRGAEELQELPEDILDAMDGSELAEQMEGMEQLMDFQAENAEKMTSLNLVYTRQDLASRLAFQVMSDEEVVDVNLSQRELLEEAYTQAGIQVSAMEKVQVKFLGRDTWAMKTTAKIGELDYFALQVFNCRAGEYALTLTCASFQEDQTEELLGLFYEVK